MSKITEEVRRGVAWLDGVAPDWWSADRDAPINLNTLNIDDAGRCVAGQVFADVSGTASCGCCTHAGYEHAVYNLGLAGRETQLGFTRDAFNRSSWIQVILERRAGVAA